MPQMLPYISDEDFLKATQRLVEAARKAKAKVNKNPYKNVIDPFSALVDAAQQGISLQAWMEQEKVRQIQKALQNALGDFHQDVIGSMPGWQNAGVGGSYDVINESKKIIAEIKNKHNTMNSRSGIAVYDNLAGWLDYGKSDFTAYAVGIVPKNPEPFVSKFTPSSRGIKRAARKNLLMVDGRSFYEMAAGRKDAIDMLYKALPKMLEKVLGIGRGTLKDTGEFDELFRKAYIKK